MPFYDDMQSIATGVLKQFNQGVIKAVKVTPGGGPTYNPGAPTIVKTTLPGATAKGVEARFVAQGLAIEGDRQIVSSVVAAALAIEPADMMEVDGVAMRVVNIVKIPAAGTPVVLIFIVRS